MLELILASALFVGSHFLISSTALRGRLVAALGENLYRAFYSLLSAALLIWTGFAFGRAPVLPLFEPGLWRLLPVIVMPPALLLLVAGITQKNPTAALPGSPSEGADPAPGILAVTRHPVMWAIGLWALAHLLANGDAAGTILFGAMAVLALGGTLAIDARKRRDWGPEAWARLQGASSNIPFLALFQGRARTSLAEIGWWRIALALVLYGALLYAHGFVFGVPAVSP
ncbi:MAG: NnrU family protein [Pseudomonadota bacterium]